MIDNSAGFHLQIYLTHHERSPNYQQRHGDHESANENHTAFNPHNPNDPPRSENVNDREPVIPAAT